MVFFEKQGKFKLFLIILCLTALSILSYRKRYFFKDMILKTEWQISKTLSQSLQRPNLEIVTEDYLPDIILTEPIHLKFATIKNQSLS